MCKSEGTEIKYRSNYWKHGGMCHNPSFYWLDKHHDKKQLVEEMFILSYKLRSTIDERQGRNLEAWTDAEAIKEYSLLACFSWLSELLFLNALASTS